MNVNLGISLPSTGLQALELAVVVLNALVDIQAEKADTEWKEDKALIFDVIQKSAGGTPLHIDIDFCKPGVCKN